MPYIIKTATRTIKCKWSTAPRQDLRGLKIWADIPRAARHKVKVERKKVLQKMREPQMATQNKRLRETNCDQQLVLN
jgi:hypothetical protein